MGPLLQRDFGKFSLGNSYLPRKLFPVFGPRGQGSSDFYTLVEGPKSGFFLVTFFLFSFKFSFWKELGGKFHQGKKFPKKTPK